MTFSNVIEQFVLDNYDCRELGKVYSSNGALSVYGLSHRGKEYAFMM